jgi:hypothetical protein
VKKPFALQPAPPARYNIRGESEKGLRVMGAFSMIMMRMRGGKVTLRIFSFVLYNVIPGVGIQRNWVGVWQA